MTALDDPDAIARLDPHGARDVLGRFPVSSLDQPGAVLGYQKIQVTLRGAFEVASAEHQAVIWPP